MRRNDTQPEITFFPSEAQEKNLFFQTQSIHQEVLHTESSDSDLSDLLKKLGRVVWKLLVALKYQVFKFWRRYIGISRKDIPYVKLAVLAFLVYIITQDQFNFSMNMKSPLAYFSDDNEKPSHKSEVHAQAITWEGDGGNPFAPASPDMLKNKATIDYINRFSGVAQTEMRKYGIPASIKMAQALIESRAGDSRLAKANHNHFGMKCFSRNCPKGHCSNFFDDHHKDFFRKYGSAWESWRSHSQMLVSGRYKPLLKHGRDYKKWADGLKELGYATDKKYNKKLKSIIEKYKLYKLDEG